MMSAAEKSAMVKSKVVRFESLKIIEISGNWFRSFKCLISFEGVGGDHF